MIGNVMILSFAVLHDAIAQAWGPDTCDPRSLDDWSTSNPAWGQCGVTALVVNDLVGGEIILAEVRYPDGTRQGVHYWNRVGSVDIDLTRQQFTKGEVVGVGAVAQRPTRLPKLFPERYELLYRRTLGALDSHSSGT